MEKSLIDLLKKYISIFIEEYSIYLDKEQLELLKNINYANIFEIADLSNPIGTVCLEKIQLPKSADDLIIAMKKMDNYGQNRHYTINHNCEAYLKSICDNGYDVYDYYANYLMYFVFKLIVKNDSIITDGFISNEILLLGDKYHFRCSNVFAREQFIAHKLSTIIGYSVCRNILFMDKPSAFRYLCEYKGYRYARLYNDISDFIDTKFKKIKKNDYQGFEGIITYAKDYDSISYGDIYNHLLDFEVDNQKR